MKNTFVSAVMIILCNVSIAQSPLVSMNNGKLVYNYYANSGETNVVNKIPDFSFAGYKGGGVPLPDVPVKKTVEPVTGNNRAIIQAAIDEVSSLSPDANGFRGAVLLKKGVYTLADSVVITTSGVVLRGEGNGPNGTVIIATAKKTIFYCLFDGHRCRL